MEFVIIQYTPTDLNEADADLNLSLQGQANPQIIKLKGIVGPVAQTVNDYNYISYLKAYPNPANNDIKIEYSLENSIPVSLFIYNMQGELIKDLGKFIGTGGINNVEWNGLDANGNAIPNVCII